MTEVDYCPLTGDGSSDVPFASALAEWADPRAALRFAGEEVSRLLAENAALRAANLSLAERVFAQAELLGRRAERGGDPRRGGPDSIRGA